MTVPNPVLGYEKATERAAEAYNSKTGILKILREKEHLTGTLIPEILDSARLAGIEQTKDQKK